MSKLKKFKSFFALERNIAVFSVSNIILLAGIYLWNNFLPKFFETLGASAVIVGLLFSIESGLQSVFHIFGGYLSDSYGRKRIYILSLVLGTAAIFGYYISPVWFFLLPALLIHSASDGIGGTASSTLITESTKKNKRATGWSVVQSIGMLTVMITAPIGGFIIDNLGFLPGFKLSLLISIAASVLAIIFLEAFLTETLRKSKAKLKLGIGNSIIFFRNLPRKIKLFLLFMSIFFFSASITMPFQSLYILDIIKLDALQFGLLVMIGMFGSMIFSVVGGKLSDKYGRKKIILATVILYSVTSILFIISQNFVQFLLVYFIDSTCVLGFSSIIPYIVDNSKKDRSKMIGLTNAILILSSAPAPFVGGLLFNISPQTPFIAMSILMILTFAVGWKFMS
jgi:MFS transporter, DHA1 family, multidrug resistance protein